MQIRKAAAAALMLSVVMCVSACGGSEKAEDSGDTSSSVIIVNGNKNDEPSGASSDTDPGTSSDTSSDKSSDTSSESDGGNTDTSGNAPSAETKEDTVSSGAGDEPSAQEPEDVPADDSVNIINNGISVFGSGSNTRAIMLFGGNYTVEQQYAEVVSEYKSKLGKKVNVYAMVIPTASEFYCPADAQSYNASQKKHIDYLYECLSPKVKPVDVYTPLSQHTDEYIYLRTDHHWADLGGYYAAQKFAEVAGVPFIDLSDYEERVVHDYVGTMYMYSEVAAVRNNPEDLVYYVPTTVDYTTTYYDAQFGADGKYLGYLGSPWKGEFFSYFRDGSTSAYLTFMGGDAKITHVNTSTKNGRKLAIFKDSFGNTLPGFLFGSFEDIYVLDMRYFPYNAIDYLKEHEITDVLFANNAFHAATQSTVDYYKRFLTQ